MSISIVIVDYKLGNIRSVISAFEKFGVEAKVSNDKDTILNADGLILPGVGSFPQAMKNLDTFCLRPALIEYAKLNKPLLGICLGMQILFDQSEEFVLTQGLGLIEGNVIKLSFQDSLFIKLPHVGFNSINQNSNDWKKTILGNIQNQEDFYFVHSYVVNPANKSYVLSSTNYSGYNFPSTIKKGNIYGCQFHPEKSSKQGLEIIKSFIEVVSNSKSN